jgi:hypothetical protein
MADSRIEIKVGSMAFSAEGAEAWISEELEKSIGRMIELAKAAPVEPKEANGAVHVQKAPIGTLAAFLKVKNAASNQNRKFLSTAVWLHDRDKKDRLTTGDVTKALSDNQQSRLGNASDCLNQNVGKGFCEKDGKGFYVTGEGRAEIA